MKKYVIASRNIHFQILNLYRKQDPFCDIKIYTLKELERNLYPSFGVDALLYLMKEKHFSYEVGKMYLEVLPYVFKDSNNAKIEELNKLKEELLNLGYGVIPSKNDEIISQNVDIYHYSEKNNELLKVLKELNITPNFIVNKGEINNKNVTVFSKIEEEVYDVLNKIASLIDEGVNINDIKILRRNNEYDYYLRKFAPTFGFSLNIDEKKSYYSTGAFKEFKKIYVETKDIEKSLELLKEVMKEDEMYEEIKIKIEENVIEDLDFPTQYDYLSNRLKEQYIIAKRFDNAVEVINNPLLTKGKHIFVIGFVQGQFPAKSKANSLLDNNELELIGILNSKNKIKEDEEIFIDFMKSDNQISYSYSLKSNSSNFYPSPIIKALDMEENKPTFTDTFYSEKVLKYIYTDLLDNKRLYKESPELYSKILDVVKVDYLTYDNQVKSAPKIYDENKFLKLSYTALDKYYGCPFAYYMERIVRIDNIETNFYAVLGNIAHHLIEIKDKEGFDFDKEFDEDIRINSEKYPFDEREIFLLRGMIKKQIKNAVEAIKMREAFYNKKKDDGHIFATTSVKVYPEQKIEINLDDNTVIEGRIDNLTVIDDQYFVCIDYKTNSSKFDPKKLENGKSTQLPTYIYLVCNDARFSDLTPAGVYINNLLSSKAFPEIDEQLHIYKHLKLNGKTLNKEDFIYAFDQSIAQGGSSFITSLVRKEAGLSGATLIGEETFEDYKEIAKKLFSDMAKSLRENRFNIYPLVQDNKIECEYCPYFDICYVRQSQFNRPVNDSEEESDDE